ncbi:hypothetical protein STEG23_004510 [Scotinomys teguina]
MGHRSLCVGRGETVNMFVFSRPLPRLHTAITKHFITEPNWTHNAWALSKEASTGVDFNGVSEGTKTLDELIQKGRVPSDQQSLVSTNCQLDPA